MKFLRYSKFLPLLLLGTGLTAHAGVVYSFDFVPTTTFSGTPIQPFGFTFASPGFVTDSSTLPLIAFDATDGAYSESLTFGEAFNQTGQSCFVFVTSQATVNPCGSTDPPGSGSATMSSSNPLPTAAGEYSYDGLVILGYDPLDASNYDGANFAVGLTVSTTVTLAYYQGGSADNPVALPANQNVGEITANIGGQFGSDQYYGFAWDGGSFLAGASFTGTSDNESFTLSLLTSNSQSVIQQVALTGSGSFQGILNPGYLAAGNYVIGFHDDGAADPTFSLVFATPPASTAEPSTVSLLMVALGALVVSSRRVFSRFLLVRH